VHPLVRSFVPVIILVAIPALPSLAQEPVSPAVTPADSADVESMDAVLAALYDVISGPAGERDWDRFRSLFVPGATLAPAAPRPDGSTVIRVLSVEDFIQVAGEFFRREPFYEVETGRRLDRFGNVASVMSGYASRRAPGEEPFSRGVNAITLLTDGTRWYVLTIAWDVDREGNPIPEELAGAR
jgi:hypothetical protein